VDFSVDSKNKPLFIESQPSNTIYHVWLDASRDVTSDTKTEESPPKVDLDVILKERSLLLAQNQRGDVAVKTQSKSVIHIPKCLVNLVGRKNEFLY